MCVPCILKMGKDYEDGMREAEVAAVVAPHQKNLRKRQHDLTHETDDQDSSGDRNLFEILESLQFEVSLKTEKVI